MRHILKCTACSTFTMQENCPGCGKSAVTTQPPKYSPEDRYGRLRREAKKMGGLL